MVGAKKFLFDRDFAEERRSGADRRNQSAEALDAAIAAAREEGRRIGRAEAEAELFHDTSRRASFALERIASMIERLAAEFRALDGVMQAEGAAIAVAAGRRFAETLVDQHPAAEIATLVERCLRELRATPHIVIRVAPALVPEIEADMTRLAAERGFAGKLVLLGEPEIGVGDCRIEWADGGIVRDSQATAARVEALVAEHFAARQSSSGASAAATNRTE